MMHTKPPGKARGLKVYYLVGDAALPVKKPAIICHVCNNINAWGSGFVLALSAKWPKTKECYHKLFDFKKEDYPYTTKLGTVDMVKVEEDIFVANMIAQEGIRWVGKVPPIRYSALKEALVSVYNFAKKGNMTVHMPRIGCVRAGGQWPIISGIIQDVMTTETFVYTLADQKNKWNDTYEEWNG